MNFEWNPVKAKENIRKHAVSFPEASSIFADPLAITYYDPDHSVEEDRFLTIGISSKGNLLIVSHTNRSEIIRIISARFATTLERVLYETEN